MRISSLSKLACSLSCPSLTLYSLYSSRPSKVKIFKIDVMVLVIIFDFVLKIV